MRNSKSLESEGGEAEHISDVDAEVRATLRERIEYEIEDSFRYTGSEVDIREIYVHGSWAEGTAVPHESDLDIRVVIECEAGDFSNVPWVQESIRTLLGSELTEGTPFAYVDPNCVRAEAEADDRGIVL